jgi:hypothetical protein
VGEPTLPHPPDAEALALRRTRRQSLDKCWVQSSLCTADTETKLENEESPERLPRSI